MALTKPFAENGDKLAIPQTASDSSVSYNLGFTYAYALPPEEGGKFIDRAQFNQLMYDTTSQVLENKTAIATKANSSEVVKLTTNQNIQGVKTFASPPVSATNPTNNNQVANKAYVDTVANTKANANATVNLTGAQNIQGVKTFSSIPISATQPTNANQVANKAYVDTVAATKANFITASIRIGANENIKNLHEFKAFAASNFSDYYTLYLTSDIEINTNLELRGLKFYIATSSPEYKLILNANLTLSSCTVATGMINFEFRTGTTYLTIQQSNVVFNGDVNVVDNAGAEVSNFLFLIGNSHVALGVGDKFVINSPKNDIFALSGGSTFAIQTMNISGNIGNRLVNFLRPSLLFVSGSNFNGLTVTDIAANTLTNKGIWFNL